MSISVNTLTDEEIETNIDRIVAIYRQAFAAPPYNRSTMDALNFAQSFEQHRWRKGFRFVAAFENEAQNMIGFAYGFIVQPGQWWHDMVSASLPPGLKTRWFSDSFEFVELAVSPSFQGLGAGSRLHDLLLSNIQQSTAVLSTIQEETVALHLYRRRGWTVISADFSFPGVKHPYLIMGLDLSNLTASASLHT